MQKIAKKRGKSAVPVPGREPLLVKAPQENAAKVAEKLQIDYSSRNWGRVFSGIYLAVLCTFCLIYKVFPGPEFLVLCFFIYAAYRKWARRLMKDWVPFIALFLAYETMYGIADNISGIVHVNELIIVESQIFGGIPTHAPKSLQKLLF